jgi:hypothetical protein
VRHRGRRRLGGCFAGEAAVETLVVRALGRRRRRKTPAELSSMMPQFHSRHPLAISSGLCWEGSTNGSNASSILQMRNHREMEVEPERKVEKLGE